MSRFRKAARILEAVTKLVRSLPVPDGAYLEVPLVGVLRSQETLYFLKPDIYCLESVVKQTDVSFELVELEYQGLRIPAVVLKGRKESIIRALMLMLGNLPRCSPLRHPSIRREYRFFAPLPVDIKLTIEIVEAYIADRTAFRH